MRGVVPGLGLCILIPTYMDVELSKEYRGIWEELIKDYGGIILF